ncbi:MAG: hypothetical protein LUD02_06140 [Tannerellaceae bacterium]|nr:hypothetical protein [Tannerellaceae bacterium]MCD8263781.1 hypothetical protein [Tannerellaceae bacterium]
MYIQKNQRSQIVLTKVNTKSSEAIFSRKVYSNSDGTFYLGVYNSNDYAEFKASVDDNTLALTRGTLYDKFSSEIRTSAFAVVADDSPLYRRFDDKDPSEAGDAQNSPVWLKFYGYHNNAEMLGKSSPGSTKDAGEILYREGLSAEGEKNDQLPYDA